MNQTDNRFADDPLSEWIAATLEHGWRIKACDSEALVMMSWRTFSLLVKLAQTRQEPPTPSDN
jgi:hypothetical protein